MEQRVNRELYFHSACLQGMGRGGSFRFVKLSTSFSGPVPKKFWMSDTHISFFFKTTSTKCFLRYFKTCTHISAHCFIKKKNKQKTVALADGLMFPTITSFVTAKLIRLTVGPPSINGATVLSYSSGTAKHIAETNSRDKFFHR